MTTSSIDVSSPHIFETIKDIFILSLSDKDNTNGMSYKPIYKFKYRNHIYVLERNDDGIKRK